MPHTLQWLTHLFAATLKPRACAHLIQVSETTFLDVPGRELRCCHFMCAYPSDIAVHSSQTGIDLPKLYLSQRPPEGVPQEQAGRARLQHNVHAILHHHILSPINKEKDTGAAPPLSCACASAEVHHAQ